MIRKFLILMLVVLGMLEAHPDSLGPSCPAKKTEPVVLSHQRIDHGEVLHGEPVMGEVVVENVSKTDSVSVDSVRKSCTCEDVDFTTGTLLPGEKRSLAYRIDTVAKAPSRPHEASIYIACSVNGSQFSREFSVHFRLKPLETITPSEIDLGTMGKSNRKAVVPLVITSVSGHPPQKPECALPGPQTRISRWTPTPGGYSSQLDLDLSEEKSRGDWKSEILIFVGERVHRVPIVARLADDVDPLWSRMVLGPCAPGETASAENFLKLAPGVQILKVFSPDIPGLVIRQEEQAAEPRMLHLAVDWTCLEKAPSHRKGILIVPYKTSERSGINDIRIQLSTISDL